MLALFPMAAEDIADTRALSDGTLGSLNLGNSLITRFGAATAGLGADPAMLVLLRMGLALVTAAPARFSTGSDGGSQHRLVRAGSGAGGPAVQSAAWSSTLIQPGSRLSKAS